MASTQVKALNTRPAMTTLRHCLTWQHQNTAGGISTTIPPNDLGTLAVQFLFAPESLQPGNLGGASLQLVVFHATLFRQIYQTETPNRSSVNNCLARAQLAQITCHGLKSRTHTVPWSST